VGKPHRALFVCEANLHRSPTAERLYSATPGVEERSAGTSPLARVQVTEELLQWADAVFVMERRLHRLLLRRFAAALAGKKLAAVLVRRLTPHLGEPVVAEERGG
jgi:predicted protein tyrosine phosphatase